MDAGGQQPVAEVGDVGVVRQRRVGYAVLRQGSVGSFPVLPCTR
ncbi:MAG: hypothetical protein R2731_00530 [Nocardioides sp.]